MNSSSQTNVSNKSSIKRLSNLKAAVYNPRTISPDAFEGLSFSISEFGDLSGIVFNTRTGNLVAGHQRVKALTEKYGDLNIQDEVIITPAGDEFKIRFVDWDEIKEKAANLAANNPVIQGKFTPGAKLIINEIKLVLPKEHEKLRLGDLGKELKSVDPEPLYQEGDKEFHYESQFGVIVICSDERQQIQIYERLQTEGFEVRVVKT